MKLEYTLDNVISTYTNYEGEKQTHFDTTLALGILLIDGPLILSNIIGKEQFEDEDRPNELITGIYVNASDVFAWGCADSEPIITQEIETLFLMWCEDKYWGTIKWLCKKRGRKPQQPIIDDMKKKGKWCELLENLPDYV